MQIKVIHLWLQTWKDLVFRSSKNVDRREAAWLLVTTQITRNRTKWSVKIFEWQSARSNLIAISESLGFDFAKVDEVQDLTVDIAEMSPLSLNFWITKFAGEIGNRLPSDCGITNISET